jgi:hypothetical protein
VAPIKEGTCDLISSQQIFQEKDVIITGDLSVLLRAERFESERVYTINIECTDPSVETFMVTTTVTVPKSQKK